MKIGIDHHPARTHYPGIGRYSRELVRALLRLPDCPELRLTDVGRAKRTIGEPALGLDGAPRPPKVARSGLGRRIFSALRRTADGMAGGVDLYHRMLPDWPPVGAAREVIAVAELFEPGSPRDRDLATVLARADAIVFSAWTAGRVAERYGLPPERIHRVPVGCDHWLRDLAPAAAPRKDPPQILVLGAVHPRRRPERVLRALEALRRRRAPAQLLYVGPRTAHSDRFLRADLGSSIARDQVLWNPNAPERDMARILAASSVLVHLSEGEETAVTPLEGLTFGLPVVASRIPPFEEDLGAAARLLAPEEEEDADALAGVLLEAIAARDDEAATAARKAQAARFSWEEDARATLAVYQGIVARPGP